MKETKTRTIIIILVIFSITNSAIRSFLKPGAVSERIGLSYAMSALILPEQPSFSAQATKQLGHWILMERKQLLRDRRWSIGSQRKRIDVSLALLDDCYRTLHEGKHESIDETVLECLCAECQTAKQERSKRGDSQESHER